MDKKRLGSFVIGGLAGMLAGILIAPKSGRETRGGLSNRAGEARQRGSESYFDARERLRERVFVPPRTPGTASENVAQTQSSNLDADLDTDVRDATHPDVHSSGNPPPGRPFLRDVSRNMEDEGENENPDEIVDEVVERNPLASGNRPDELRRKIRETRERLKSHELNPDETPSDATVSGETISDDGDEDDPR